MNAMQNGKASQMNSELYDHYIAGGLTPEEATLAVKNAVGKTIKKEDASVTLLESFVFIDSQEGHAYWWEICKRILPK